jgi:hypothetical protein
VDAQNGVLPAVVSRDVVVERYLIDGTLDEDLELDTTLVVVDVLCNFACKSLPLDVSLANRGYVAALDVLLEDVA